MPTAIMGIGGGPSCRANPSVAFVEDITGFSRIASDVILFAPYISLMPVLIDHSGAIYCYA